MGTVTINIEDAVEKEFRKTVEQLTGLGKGKLGKAIKEALQLWIQKQQEQQIASRQLALLKKGFPMGTFTIKSRSELHERRI